ncbi:GNAT family N-acetyltransferase [Methylocystis sp. IM3]|uniref:GNAT family N-acetyltransferase n=1 Tax=unclassified Methylocystis TaxID=2625913 RepID=UPI000FAB811E|nr:MAG: GNAT family N-acetyltransferase [Hyphomicrobiales bacterium]
MQISQPQSTISQLGNARYQFDQCGSSLAAYSHLRVFTRFEDARTDWLALSREAAISPYQSFEFLSMWSDAIEASEDVTPFLIAAQDAKGAPSALLPLCIIGKGPLRIAAFLGGREANFNLPLLSPDAQHDQESLWRLLHDAAKHAPSPPDLYFLRNQPRRFENAENPLVFANARPSASCAYGTTLPATVDELAARLSKENRKKLRKKEARLAEFGRVEYEHRVSGERRQAIAAALLEQKSARFSAVGSKERRFLTRLLRHASGSEEGALELHGLSVGGRIVAAYAGVRRSGRFSAMLNSFDTDEDIARCSPGELLLHALMRDLVLRGMTHFDLGAGEARYKRAVCEEEIALYDQIVPVSARGRLAAPLLAAFLRLKRRAKRAPALIHPYYRLRSLLRP